ncbi:hypothetical protein [Streptomyces sp. NPDC058595]|uniref:hypothetical protein n=1 Tax=Streptomyces sp. NPDC058595 TaxID=3346550 RepID=UPI00365E1B28
MSSRCLRMLGMPGITGHRAILAVGSVDGQYVLVIGAVRHERDVIRAWTGALTTSSGATGLAAGIRESRAGTGTPREVPRRSANGPPPISRPPLLVTQRPFTPEEADPLLAPLRRAAPVLLDTVAGMPLVDFASIHQDPADPLPFHEWTAMLGQLTRETVDVLVELAGSRAGHPVEYVELRHLGGALGRQIGPPSAVGNRDAEFALWVMTMGPPSGADLQHAYAKRLLATVRSWSTGGSYLNFTSSDATTVRRRTRGRHTRGFVW